MYESGQRILMVGNFLSSSLGLRFVCEDLATQLAACGWSVLTTSNRPGRASRLLDMISTVWHRRREYDVAHVDVYSGLAFFWAEMVCWLLHRLGKPYVVTLRGGNLPVFARCWPRRVGRLLGSAAAATVPSHYLLHRMKGYRSNLDLLPNPLHLDAYSHGLRKQPRPHLVWLRAFHGGYNPSLALRTLTSLVSDFSDACLIMVGPDKGDGSLQAAQQLAEELEVADRVRFCGQVPKSKVPHWLQKGDIYLNTTNVDNTPVTVLEAMACGLCVVSTNVGGIPHLLEHESDALLVPPDDPEAMAAAVRRILTEPGLAERLSGHGGQKAAQFDWSIVLPQWERLLTAVAYADEP